jgi:hypothetical protein
MSFDPSFVGFSMSLMQDAATIAHLAAMAVGLGSAVFADWTILRGMALPLSADQLAVVRRAHGLITVSLAALWLSGLTLLALKTEFDVMRITPKLVAKLGTVAMLTVTASTMGRVALPRLSGNLGRRLTGLPASERCALAACFALSSAGWGIALLLGGSSILRTAGREVIMLVLALFATAVVAALTTAVLLGRADPGRVRRAGPVAQAAPPSAPRWRHSDLRRPGRQSDKSPDDPLWPMSFRYPEELQELQVTWAARAGRR